MVAMFGMAVMARIADLDGMAAIIKIAVIWQGWLQLVGIAVMAGMALMGLRWL